MGKDPLCSGDRSRRGRVPLPNSGVVRKGCRRPAGWRLEWWRVRDRGLGECWATGAFKSVVASTSSLPFPILSSPQTPPPTMSVPAHVFDPFRSFNYPIVMGPDPLGLRVMPSWPAEARVAPWGVGPIGAEAGADPSGGGPIDSDLGGPSPSSPLDLDDLFGSIFGSPTSTHSSTNLYFPLPSLDMPLIVQFNPPCKRCARMAASNDGVTCEGKDGKACTRSLVAHRQCSCKYSLGDSSIG